MPASPTATATPRVGETATALRTADVLALARSGALAPARLETALRRLDLVPDAAGWRQAWIHLLPAIAVLATIGGVLCIVAANWQDLGRFAKFGAAMALLVALAGAALATGLDRTLGRSLLTIAIGLIGPALALYGQTYQTGADVHGLMFTWALLALPWVLASRQAMAWMLWLAVLQGGGVFWLMSRQAWPTIPGPLALPTWLVAAACQALLLVAWEQAARRFDWLASRWPQRILAWLLLAILTVVAMATVLGIDIDRASGPLAIVGWIGCVAGFAFVYGHRLADPVILSGVLLAGTAMAGAVVGRMTHSLFLTGLVVLAAAAFGAAWVRRRQLAP